MKNFLLPALLPLALLVGSAPGLSCSRNGVPTGTGGPSGDLIIFHAGSLSVPFKEVAAAFGREYPGVNVVREAAGSRTCARKIADLGKPCDIIASSDYKVIETLLMPDHAEWCIPFATNEMAIVYSDSSQRADDISADNWYEILAEEAVAFGRSDPDMDPCGYRAVLTLKLAEKFYNVEGLAERLLAKDVRCIRPKETDLLALLEMNEIDYIFLYRSVAEQHGLKYLVLPDEINLKNPALADLYGSVSVEVSGREPGARVTVRGEPMVYGVTIPRSAPNREAAIAFLCFLLDEDRGMAIMARNGQASVVPSPTPSFDNIPAPLKRFVQRAE